MNNETMDQGIPSYQDEQQLAKNLKYSRHILSCASYCHQDILGHLTECPAKIMSQKPHLKQHYILKIFK